MARNKYPEQTVDRILDAAQQLFIEKGYDKTTIQDIVDRLAGLSRGAIYHHFKGKEDILDAVTLRLTQRYVQPLEALPENLTALEKLQWTIRDSLRLEIENSTLYMTMLALTAEPRYLAEQIHAAMLGARDTALLLDAAIADGSATLRPEDVPHAAELILLLINVWALPTIHPADAQRLYGRFVYMGRLFEKMGVPLFNEEILALCKQFSALLAEQAENIKKTRK